nr:hypothetical protein [Tanacetum cinerariifolium]
MSRDVLGSLVIKSMVISHLFNTRLDDAVALSMVRNVTRQEVKVVLFSMGNDKVPRLDGFTAAFFKEVWEIVADDITNAVSEFFVNGKLLQVVNHTIIALLPKVRAPRKVTDYRLISYCNVLFKCISKIIANRIKESLKCLGVPSKSTFKKPVTRWIGHSFEKFLLVSGFINVSMGFTKAILYPCIYSLLSWRSLLSCFIGGFRRMGRLPVKYLGVPLVSSWLLIRDYKELVEKVYVRIHDWRRKSLSIVGRVGLSPSSKLRDILNNGVFSWPSELSSKHYFHLSINMPNARTNRIDLLEWQNETGTVKQFSICSVWNSIRPRSNMVVWFDVVWFLNCIPRHAFNLWLIVKQRLKMQDKLCSWDLSSSRMASCPLCETQIDSHEHLFFKCLFSTQIWNHMKGFAGMNSLPLVFSDIISFIMPIAKRRSS